MIKFTFAVLWSVFCLVLALFPETVMYFLYAVIDPTTSVERLLVIAVFLVAGGGLSVVFGFLGLTLWAHGISELLKS